MIAIKAEKPLSNSPDFFGTSSQKEKDLDGDQTGLSRFLGNKQASTEKEKRTTSNKPSKARQRIVIPNFMRNLYLTL